MNMDELDLESTTSEISRIKLSESAECLLLNEMRETLSKDWVAFLTDTKNRECLARMKAGAATTGEVARLVHEVQEKMSGDKYLKMQSFMNEFEDLPGVLSMKDALSSLTVHLEVYPEISDIKCYPKRLIWLRKLFHVIRTLTGQMDVVLGLPKGQEPKLVLKKTKSLLAARSTQAIQTASSSAENDNCLMPLSRCCTLL